jgi:uncharacterized protein (TIGR03000 family)
MRIPKTVCSTTALFLSLVACASASAGLFTGPYDFSLGPYYGTHRYSYAEAYGYNLPFTPASSIWHYPQDWPAYYREPILTIPPRYLYPWRPAPVADLNAIPAVPPPNVAVVVVQVPPGAVLWFDGAQTRQMGPTRVFTTPPLPPGGVYHYTVKMRWNANGVPTERTERVAVAPGQQVRLQLPAPAPAPVKGPPINAP